MKNQSQQLLFGAAFSICLFLLNVNKSLGVKSSKNNAKSQPLPFYSSPSLYSYSTSSSEYAYVNNNNHNKIYTTHMSSKHKVADQSDYSRPLNYCSFFNNRAPSPQVNLKNCTWYKENSCCLQKEIESTFSKVYHFKLCNSFKLGLFLDLLVNHFFCVTLND
jgi:hypothetical protein